MSKVDGVGHKVPTIVKAAGIATAAVATGATIYAVTHGKNPVDAFKKAGAENVKFSGELGAAVETLKEGYIDFGKAVLKTGGDVAQFVREKYSAAKDFVKSKLPAKNPAQDIVDDISDNI